MNMKLLEVVTTPSIYHGCYTWKTFWEENFTLGEFTPVNIQNCGRHNISKTDRSRIVIRTSPWTSC